MQFVLIEYGVLAAILLSVLTAALAFVWLYDPSPHRHDGFHRADVRATFDVSDDTTGFRLRVVFDVDDGGPFTATTRSFALAHQVTNTACVERRLRENGRVFFYIVHSSHCP
ncbi:MAG: hypothetical protein AAFY38_01220 [Pseudomonadota bacterium]